MRFLIGSLLAVAAFAAEPKVIPIWPGAAPGSETWTQQETEKEVDGPKGSEPRKLHFVYNVTKPTLTAFLPDPAAANGTAVIVCPGGGFSFLASDYEGTDVARWLNSFGVTAFVLKYRVVRTGDEGETSQMAERRKEVVPLAVADGVQAMRIVRSRAGEWGIQPNRIGIMGFSAGGSVASSVALERDAAARASFLVAVYAAAPEDVTPPEGAGPLFAVQAADDRFNNTIRLFSAWNKATLPSEMHIYATGGHGFSMIRRNAPVDSWTDRLRDWLGNQGFLKPAR
jgi:acetyl esterase/lipase